jgi:hypothetical protein
LLVGHLYLPQLSDAAQGKSVAPAHSRFSPYPTRTKLMAIHLKTIEKNSCHQPWQAGLSLCQQIKARLSLREVGRMFGFDLPERDHVKFRSPLRPDSNPSCTIKGLVMRDWSRDENLDAIGLYAAAKGITNREAIHELAEKLGLSPRKSAHSEDNKREQKPSVTFESREPSEEDFASILRTRQLPAEAMAGLLLAHTLNVLQFAEIAGASCWVVSDASKQCAEARRLDGRPFAPIGNLGERKAHTLRGSTKSWPVGLALGVSDSRKEHLRRIPLVVVEGGPDLLAAFALLAIIPTSQGDVQPVAMLGSSASISKDALSMVRGRQAIILAHGDEAGKQAANRWSNQLAAADCRIQLRNLSDGLDLNDLVAAHGLNAAKEAIL